MKALRSKQGRDFFKQDPQVSRQMIPLWGYPTFTFYSPCQTCRQQSLEIDWKYWLELLALKVLYTFEEAFILLTSLRYSQHQIAQYPPWEDPGLGE